MKVNEKQVDLKTTICSCTGKFSTQHLMKFLLHGRRCRGIQIAQLIGIRLQVVQLVEIYLGKFPVAHVRELGICEVMRGVDYAQANECIVADITV